MFVDEDFPPKQASIFNDWNTVDSNRLQYYKRLVWKRTSELQFVQGIQNERINPNDVI